MQNIAFITFLLNSTSGFIHPLNWPAQPYILSSFLPRVPVLVHIYLLWLGAIQGWWAACSFPLHYQNNPVFSAMHNSFRHPNSLCDSDHQRHEPWISRKMSVQFPVRKIKEFSKFSQVWKHQMKILQPTSFFTCLQFWCPLLLISSPPACGAVLYGSIKRVTFPGRRWLLPNDCQSRMFVVINIIPHCSSSSYENPKSNQTKKREETKKPMVTRSN